MTEQPDRYVVVPAVAPLAAGAVSPAYRLRWATNGRIVNILGGVVGPANDVDVAKASIGVRILVEGEQEMVTNGEGGDFMPYALWFMGKETTTVFNRPVRGNSIWTVTFKNYHGFNAYTPALAFGIKV